ncbi:hypothetical protein A2767_05475 [Candidatus Roizmanbacteria bacterium RIFCSPHIGHO2_01_FULL_35_10]|uniref:RNA ligase domain-containing protein n=1 Tax=Candidatus Roizmanbacteria bacterium RIFCSPLOWO2_01_FULL_35_13 TaxID=1802055 RepID=A0A1F7IBK6_9BACT|nr:MAG: hypothetical protein A2767_05475 [Candidatus Roizmanbacteria bacterium RIFCSPHIGHO2_01_FULL_35_10]OGK40742.1 MAG: hypothetical protein A3A74_03945 [Candidatus Roizmanbacteria bacterium RIFCSPLOWO2_01_FULL_35_13]
MRYPKILELGATPILDIFKYDVIVEEKVDGSLFRFGKTKKGEFFMGSKSVDIYEDNIPKMFEKACNYALKIKDKITNGFVFFCEYLEKPKHNVLVYGRIPKNNLMLFEVWDGEKFLFEIKEKWAKKFNIETSSVLFKGKIKSVEDINHLLEKESLLGKEKVEGLIAKNYRDFYLLGGKAEPMFGKYVREQFKERHATEWKIKTTKGKLESYIESFRNENRWMKAIFHLRDQEKLEFEPRDIGKLLKEVEGDIKEEEKEKIKEYLYRNYIDQIIRTATKGFPEFYKKWLLERGLKVKRS